MGDIRSMSKLGLYPISINGEYNGSGELTGLTVWCIRGSENNLVSWFEFKCNALTTGVSTENSYINYFANSVGVYKVVMHSSRANLVNMLQYYGITGLPLYKDEGVSNTLDTFKLVFSNSDERSLFFGLLRVLMPTLRVKARSLAGTNFQVDDIKSSKLVIYNGNDIICFITANMLSSFEKSVSVRNNIMQFTDVVPIMLLCGDRGRHYPAKIGKSLFINCGNGLATLEIGALQNKTKLSERKYVFDRNIFQWLMVKNDIIPNICGQKKVQEGMKEYV